VNSKPKPHAVDASIVLVRQDDRAQAEACVQHLLEYSEGVRLELLLVEDAPPERSELLESLSGNVERLTHDERRGVVPSWNEAAQTARGRWLVFLQAHALASPGWLAALAHFVEAHPEVAAISPVLLGRDGVERTAGCNFASAACVAEGLAVAMQGARVLDRRGLPLLGDGCLMVRADAFEEVGGFDSRLGTRAASLDLALKLHARRRGVALQPESLLLSVAEPPVPAGDAADGTALRRRWGVAEATNPDALWAEGRIAATAAGIAGFDGHAGHFCDDPNKVPPPFVEIGKRTYLVAPTRFLAWNAEERIRIGGWCSIASNVTIFTGGGHSTETISTYPFEAMLFGSSVPTRSTRTMRDTVIGNDVWIGDSAVILGGARVGDGAVVAAGSVVSGDVPPFAVVAGNPARVLRYRFSRPTVEALLRIAWWEWTEDEVRARMEWFFAPVSEFVKRFDHEGGQDAGTARAA
jgi:acetyltransferase-like isoleucine patch superfamily enzyme